MRIGLFRHFPVSQTLPSGWVTSEDLEAWLATYDDAATQPGTFDLGGVDWQACLSSDMTRTRVTADAVFEGLIEHTPLLREPRLGRFRTGRMRLPIVLWRQMLRIAWLIGHSSQRQGRDEFRTRVLAVADRLETMTVDTLVVSHAGMISYLAAELRRRGFAGPRPGIAKHARAYVFSR